MPELPEVETLRQDMATLLAGKTISRVTIIDPRVVQGFAVGGGVRRNQTPDGIEGPLRGRRVREILRRGKYLIIDVGPGLFLMFHLRMTGQLLWGPLSSRARAVMYFEGEEATLNFCDTRRFGEMWLSTDWRRDPSLALLGPEPLEEGWDSVSWGRTLRRSTARIHSALLDQRRLAGVGNIYATEALFLTGLRPGRRANTIRSETVPGLLQNIRRVLAQGVRYRGVSFRDYRDVRGQRGEGKEHLLVYGKGGRPCVRCAQTLRRIKIGGRGTVFCPRCQK